MYIYSVAMAFYIIFKMAFYIYREIILAWKIKTLCLTKAFQICIIIHTPMISFLYQSRPNDSDFVFYFTHNKGMRLNRVCIKELKKSLTDDYF